MITTLDALPPDDVHDLVVVGSGAGGMATALFAAIAGLKVLLVERTEYVGGTTALSAATTWIPMNRHSSEVAVDDSLDKAERFLDGVVGNRSPAVLRRAFLESGPQAIATLEDQSQVRFRPYATHPDYEQDHEGATLRGRALEPVPFDGRSLGADLARIRPPIPEFTIFGGMMIDRTDIGHLLGLTKSWRSFRHAASILAWYGRDRLAQRRGSRLVMGNALIGRMLASLKARNVPILLEATVRAVDAGRGGVEGVTVAQNGTERQIRVRRGLVIAAGGFNRHPTRRAELLPKPTPAYSPAAPGHTGAMQDLALKLGARFGTGGDQPAFWAPVSVRRRADGSTAVFPHFVMDRSKPGTVCVDQTGRRFVNESTSYHQFGKAMFAANRDRPTIPCFIITDAVGLKRFGLGMVRMGTRNLKPFLDDGYLVEAPTIAALAAKLNMDAAVLEETVGAMNTYAKTGVDTQFGRGTTAYHRINGDAAHGPNPTLGPIDTAPFYAVRLYPGDIGAATGLVIDEWARVLKEDGSPVPGLYACGNEAQSIMGGTYPGPGITIGPAITFAYRAVRHACQAGEQRP
ncbi:FAD-dependent oxidoreductase [Xanthobacter versatilis]|uniref:FAD-dependent oxidoreductase n=1 Tax=Xanthobacter autotrophicus (strain ATCC BAA-1158 / Py2) TaxID=78245 RepID=UPI00372CB997